MKYLILIPFAVLLGLAAGSWAPKREMTQLRNEVQDLKKELKSSNKGGKLSALNNIIKIPEKSERRRVGGPPPIEVSVVSENENGTTNLVSTAAPTNSIAEKRHKRKRLMPDPKSKTFEADLEEAKELWQTRVEMARAQWLAKLDLDTEGELLFDQAFADMNEKLYLTMEVVAEGLKDSKELTNEAGLRIVNQVTSTLVETYDDLKEIVPGEQSSELEKMEMQDFIDPSVFEPLSDVRDKL